MFCALSSVVEHYLHTVGVAGSKPAARTILKAVARSLFSLLRGASRPHRAENENLHLLDGLHVSLNGLPHLHGSEGMVPAVIS